MKQLERILCELTDAHPQLAALEKDIWSAYRAIESCYANKGTLFLCGNGGSSADALHIVGELMKSFVMKRPVDRETALSLERVCPDQAGHLIENLQGALPAYALVENSSLSTAYSNDVDADMVYAQQLYGYAKAGDALLAISTSGNARNVLNAARVAKARGVVVIGLTGGTGGALRELCDVCLVMPESETYKIQELHVPVYHALCRMIEHRFFA